MCSHIFMGHAGTVHSGMCTVTCRDGFAHGRQGRGRSGEGSRNAHRLDWLIFRTPVDCWMRGMGTGKEERYSISYCSLSEKR